MPVARTLTDRRLATWLDRSRAFNTARHLAYCNHPQDFALSGTYRACRVKAEGVE